MLYLFRWQRHRGPERAGVHAGQREAGGLRAVAVGGGAELLQGHGRQAAHQMDGARVHQLQEVHRRQRRVDVR